MQLVKYLQTNKEVHHMHFFIDRFAQFTASEQRIVDALVENGAATMVSLVLDRGYPDQNHPSPSEVPAENDLFYSSAMVYRRLWKLAQQEPQQIQLQPNVWLQHNRELMMIFKGLIITLSGMQQDQFQQRKLAS